MAVPKVITAIAKSNGRAEATVGPGQSRENWAITRMTTQIAGSTTGELKVYHGTEQGGNLVDGTYLAVNDISEMAIPLIVNAGEVLTHIWTGVTPGATCFARVTYDLVP